MPILDGTAGDDALTGTPGDDVINGLAGADTIYGEAGNDELNGGDGTDLIYGGAGDDRIDGGLGGVPPGPNGQPPAVYERIFAEDGDDTIVVSGAQDGRYVQADGGAGTDTLVVNHTASQFFGFGYTGFERLHIENALNVSFASNFRSITIADSSVNFANSYNPLVDLTLQNQFLSMAFSSLRSVTGGTGNENVWIGQGSTITGKITLGDGDDRLVLDNYWPGPAPSISVAQGGAGRDQLDVWSGSYKNLSMDLFNATEFEVFGFNSEYGDRYGTLTVANLTGITEVRVGWTSALVLTQSQLSGAVLTGAFGGGYTLEAGVVVGRYGFPADGPWDRSTDLTNANSSMSTTFVNRGTVEGDVAFYTGDDLYDGRNGSIGGTVFGNAGNETLLGGSGNERFEGGYGDDLLSGGGGDDILKGGEGRDTVSYADAATGVMVNLALAGAQDTVGAGIDLLSGFEVLIGSDHADRLTAGAGNSLIFGGGGDDTLVSSADSDHLYGEAGNDTLVSNGANDEIDGGDGFDTVDFSAASASVNTNWPLRLLNIERVIGSSFNDFLSGAAEMVGGAGNDVYTVYSGSEVIEAPGQGTDRVESWIPDYTLPDDVENLTLYFDPYAGATIAPHGLRTGSGNSLDNVIIGSFGANRLSGVAGNDILYGDGGNDDLLGDDGNDVLVGGTGDDTLAGGSGNDTFQDTAAGLNGDTITDFGAGDEIVITDAVLSGFSVSLNGNALSYTGGSLTLSEVPAGRIVATAAAGGGVQLTVGPDDVRNDFNGDGRSDILWRNDAGQFQQWQAQLSGGFTSNPNASGAAPTNWFIAGTGDYNGDGRDDILWRSSAGDFQEWLGQANGGFVGNPNASGTAPTNWSIAGTGDFNGDGRDDILWRSTTGDFQEWLGQANGGFVGNPNASGFVPTNYRVTAVGDFNGDGRDDIVWRANDGGFVEWLGQSNGGFANNPFASGSAPGNWQVVGAGDFNGDGRDDILWRSSTGDFQEWMGQANGGFGANPYASGTVPTSWQIDAIGDYNGDGRDDILWRSAAGDFQEWLAQANGGFIGNPNATGFAPTAWHVQSPDIYF